MPPRHPAAAWRARRAANSLGARGAAAGALQPWHL